MSARVIAPSSESHVYSWMSGDIIVSWVKQDICMWSLVILEREYHMLLISHLGQPNCGEGRPVISDTWMIV